MKKWFDIRDEFLITRQGKQYVLFAGLLDEAHNRGLRSIDTELIQVPTAENGNVAVVKATVQMEDDRTFSGIGDASPENVGRNIVPHIIRMAETRAKARALRDAVNVGATALEELGDDEGEAPYPTSQREKKVRKPLRQVHPKSSAEPPHEEPANEEVEEPEVVGESEHTLVLTELHRIYYRIPDEKRPDEATVFNYAERGLKQAQERLKWMRFLAAGAGRLPEEPESEDEIDAQIVREFIEESVPSDAGLHDEQEEVIEELAEKLYGQEAKGLSGVDWLEEEVLGHPISDHTKSGAKQLIDTMRDELGKEQVK